MRRRAMTLVEVLAALFLLAGAATTMLVVQARALEQVRVGGLEVTAGELGRELIANWRLTGVRMSELATGALEDHAGWSWRRWSREEVLGDDLRVSVVTLELMHSADATRDPWTRQFTWFEREDEAR